MRDHKVKALEKLADTPAPYREETTASGKSEEGIDYGVVILPPVIDESNPEIDSYPEDYIQYAQERLREYKAEHGELPKYKRDKE